MSGGYGALGAGGPAAWNCGGEADRQDLAGEARSGLQLRGVGAPPAALLLPMPPPLLLPMEMGRPRLGKGDGGGGGGPRGQGHAVQPLLGEVQHLVVARQGGQHLLHADHVLAFDAVLFVDGVQLGLQDVVVLGQLDDSCLQG